MEKTLTPPRPFEDNRFATSSSLMISIFLVSVKKNSQQLTQKLETTVAGYGLEISSDKSKILMNSIKPRPSTNTKINEEVLEEVDQLKYLGST